MSHVRTLLTLCFGVVLLTACGLPPSAPMFEDVGGLTTAEVRAIDGAVFLPPIGPPIDTAGFFAGAALRLEVWALDTQNSPSRLLSTLSATVGDRYYQANWQVRETAALLKGNESVVRVVATADGLVGSVLERACRGQRACVVGSFDARIKATRSTRADEILDLTATQTLPIKVWLQASPRRPTSLDELRRLSDGRPYTDGPTGNCLVTGFNMPSQGFNALGAGFNALGAVGGLYVRSPGDLQLPPPEAYGVRMLTAGEAGAWASGLGRGGASWSGAILVVDDFHGVFEVGTEAWPTFAGVDDAPEVVASFLRSLVGGDALSHGALVLHQTLRMVEAAGYRLVAAPSPDFHVYALDGAFPFLVIAAVDIGGTDLGTSQAARRIGHALDALQHLSAVGDDDFAILDAAVNMSFVIVPCSVLDDYGQAAARIEGLDTFEEYVAALGADNAVALDFYADLLALLLRATAPEVDPLKGRIEACEGVTPLTRTPVLPPLDLGRTLKVDPPQRTGEYVRYPSAVDPALWVEVRLRPDPEGRGELLDWRSSHPIGRVEVKGGVGSLIFTQAAGATSGEGLHAPLGPNGRTYHDVSHAVFVPLGVRPLAFLEDGAWKDVSWSDLVERGSATPIDCARGRINYVAASGNFGLPYAMFPAAWPEVVAVAAQYAVPGGGFDPRKAGFANAGEVVAPGALYELSRTASGTQVLAYAGTSFSAPVVSLFTALDLMRDVPSCGLPARSLLTDEGDVENVPLDRAACVVP
jgi:hypothetical protein